MTINADLQRRASVMVSREVYLCLSSLVSTLAGGAGDRIDDSTLLNLADQAQELCSPVLDYEGAAREKGWNWDEGGPHFFRNRPGASAFEPYEYQQITSADWQALCDAEDIEPHELEIYEHWSVSPWLADKLEAKGERIDRDFAGLTVWARTTTGQAISIDAVIEQITEETGINFGGGA